MTTRAQIRSAVKTLIEAGAIVHPVYSDRVIDVTKKNSYLQLFFGEGADNYENAEPETTATFSISYGSIDATDDELDSLLDTIQGLLIADLPSQLNAQLLLDGATPILYMLRVTFEYLKSEQSQHNELIYTYQIHYSE